jgi:DNA-binding transcriptional LysR family regulator
LLDGGADMIFHRVDPSDPRVEQLQLHEVAVTPVVAPGFLPFAPSNTLTPEAMRPFTQCVIRDTAQRPSSESFFVIDGAHQCSAPSQQMKKELVLHGLAWGHLPKWMIEEELRDGRLISIASRHLHGRTEHIAAIRRRRSAHGPVLDALWSEFERWADLPPALS